MNYETLKKIVEAALFATGSPMTVDKIQKLFEEHEQPERDDIKCALEELQGDYTGKGIELKEVASGYRFQVVQECAPWISRMWEEKPTRYSRALLETLALIAYRQPITRSEIEEIRGVSVSTTIIKTLQEREWVRVVGHRDVPGRPALYATTRQFLDYFDLKSLEELPPLAEIRNLDELDFDLDHIEGALNEAANDEMSAEETAEIAETESEHIDSDDVREETEEVQHAAEELEHRIETILEENKLAFADEPDDSDTEIETDAVEPT